MSQPVDRRAARVLLVDGQRRVLLFEGHDPADVGRGRWWFTPGGGLDEGENAAQAAVRELQEETGLVTTADALGDVVHRRVTTFQWGGVTYRQEEDYFLLRVDAHEVDSSGFNDLETAAVFGHRWWDPAELLATGERYYPTELLGLLEELPC